jgi:hypothetical protein
MPAVLSMASRIVSHNACGKGRYRQFHALGSLGHCRLLDFPSFRFVSISDH